MGEDGAVGSDIDMVGSTPAPAAQSKALRQGGPQPRKFGTIQAPSYKTIKTLLEQRMEAAPLRGGEATADDAAVQLGATNVRGRGYYH